MESPRSRLLKKSLEMSQSLGNERTALCLQSLNFLGIVCNFLGNFDDGERYYQESIRCNRQNLAEENVERVKQNKKPLSEDELPNFGALFNHMVYMYQMRGVSISNVAADITKSMPQNSFIEETSCLSEIYLKRNIKLNFLEGIRKLFKTCIPISFKLNFLEGIRKLFNSCISISSKAVEGFNDTGVIHDTDIHSDGRHAAHNSQGDKRTEIPDFIVKEGKHKELQEKLKQQADLAILKVKIKSFGNVIMSKQKTAGINVYISVIKNETFRMMENIDIITSQAMELLGPERTQIFLDLLADMLPIFGSAGAIPGFVPNMAKSAIRDQVISFFKQARDEMNQIMTSLLSFPGGERLQKMPEPDFRALLEIIIEFSLKSKSNKAKGLSLKEKRLIVDDLQRFVATLGERIPEKLLNRLSTGHEVVVYRFGDRNERSQPPEKRENRLIHSIYSPSDCRLFIHIPTETGSYWHELEMQRANRFKTHVNF